jgi:cytochrome c-type biogenesis protein CcmH/NrfG
MALFAILFIAVATLLLMWRLGKLSSGASYVSAAGLVLGLVGYSMQGSPNLPSAPVASKALAPLQLPATNNAQNNLIGQVGPESQILAQADAYFRINRPDLAARVLQGALSKDPKNPALWTGLGNAMVGHEKGFLSPAAEYAYVRALQIAPVYPGALYFYAVALAENDRAKEARPFFERLVKTIPIDAPFRKSLIADLDRAGLLSQKTVPLTGTAK